MPSALFQAHRARIVELLARQRLPASFGERDSVEAEGLMSYGPDDKVLYRRLADYVDRILKGVWPGDLPFQEPTKFELVINCASRES